MVISMNYLNDAGRSDYKLHLQFLTISLHHVSCKFSKNEKHLLIV